MRSIVEYVTNKLLTTLQHDVNIPSRRSWLEVHIPVRFLKAVQLDFHENWNNHIAAPLLISYVLQAVERPGGSQKCKKCLNLRTSATAVVARDVLSSLRLGLPCLGVVLGSAEQAILTVVQGCTIVCVDERNGGYRLFIWMSSLVTVRLDRMTNAFASMLGRPVKINARYLINFFWYHSLAQLRLDELSRRQRLHRVSLGYSESNRNFDDHVARGVECSMNNSLSRPVVDSSSMSRTQYSQTALPTMFARVPRTGMMRSASYSTGWPIVSTAAFVCKRLHISSSDIVGVRLDWTFSAITCSTTLSKAYLRSLFELIYLDCNACSNADSTALTPSHCSSVLVHLVKKFSAITSTLVFIYTDMSQCTLRLGGRGGRQASVGPPPTREL